MHPNRVRHSAKPVRRSAVTGMKTALLEELAPAQDLRLVENAASQPVAVGDTEGELLALAKVVEQRDSHTAGHCERLAFTGVALGVAMRLESRHLLSLYLGGYLHDIGKVGIPDAILFKPSDLSAEEWATMKTHAARGEEICRPLKSMRDVLPLIRHHHERMDGTGYPDGLSGDAVPVLARVLQTVDIYDALTSPRPYKDALPRARALEILEEEVDKGWRDREITSIFVRMHKRVHSRIASYRPPAGASVPSMAQSLSNLQQFLAQ
jgi:putative two-component system response regulator